MHPVQMDKHVAFFVQPVCRMKKRPSISGPAGLLSRKGSRIPADAPMPMARLGIEFTAEAAWKGTCYLDAVEWQ